MNQQSEALREVRRPAALDATRSAVLSAPLVVVSGGKGGVGKTTLVANLGRQLAARGLRVLLVDLDFALANLDIALGVEPQRRILDVFDGTTSFGECVLQVERGLDLLPAASGAFELARPDAARRARLTEGLAQLSADYDLLIGDAAAGIGPDVLAFAGLANVCLLCTTPDPAAIADAYGVLKALDAWAAEMGRDLPTPELFVNGAAGLHEAQSVAGRIAAVSERFLARRPRLAGWMAHSALVRGSARERRSFVGGSGSSGPELAIARLAERIARLAGLDLGRTRS